MKTISRVVIFCLWLPGFFGCKSPDAGDVAHQRNLEVVDAAVRFCTATIREGNAISGAVNIDIAKAFREGKSSAEIKGEYLQKLKTIEGVADTKEYFKCISDKWPLGTSYVPVSIERTADFREVTCNFDKVILTDEIVINGGVPSYHPRMIRPSHKKVLVYDLLVSEETEASIIKLDDGALTGTPEGSWNVSTKRVGEAKSMAKVRWVWIDGHRSPDRSFSQDTTSGVLVRTAAEYILADVKLNAIVPHGVKIEKPVMPMNCLPTTPVEGASYSWSCKNLNARVGADLNRLDIDWSWNLWSRCAV